MDWVCDDAWKGPFTQSVYFFGSAIGSFMFGILSDLWGRKPIFIVSNAILFLSGVTLPYCQDFYSFTAMRFVMGLVHPTYYFSIYLLGKGDSMYDVRSGWGGAEVLALRHENRCSGSR